MPKVKIIELEPRYDYDDYDGIRNVSAEGLTEWETISEEEYGLLNKYLNAFTRGNGKELLVVRLDSIPVEKRIINIREELAKIAKKEEEKREKARLVQAKRDQEALVKKEEKERKLLETLKKKYDGLQEKENDYK